MNRTEGQIIFHEEPVAVVPPTVSQGLSLDLLPDTISQINRTLDLGDPVSCWTGQAAWLMVRSLTPNGEPSPVQLGIREALDPHNIPQTMVGTILHLALQIEQILQGTDESEWAADRLVEVAVNNCISFPLEGLLATRSVSSERAGAIRELLSRKMRKYQDSHQEMVNPAPCTL